MAPAVTGRARARAVRPAVHVARPAPRVPCASQCTHFVTHHSAIAWRGCGARPSSSISRRYLPALAEIAALEAGLRDRPEAALAARGEPSCGSRRAHGGPRPALRTAFFALARECARRALGLRPFDVQIVAALALDDGAIVEMQTGEGKTLAAVMPAALNALSRRRRARPHLQRLPGAPRRRVDAARLPARSACRSAFVQEGHAARRSPPRLRRRRHLRHRQGSRASITCATCWRDGARTGPPAVPLRARGRGRLAPDRRGARAAGHRRRRSGRPRPRRLASRLVAAPRARASTSTPTSTAATSS